MKQETLLGRISSWYLGGVSLVCLGGALGCLGQDKSYLFVWEILTNQSTSMVMAVYLDWMALIFLSTVSFISGLVLIYSDSYMEGEKFVGRFLLLVLLFVLSMVFLIISPNLLSILLGWDGLGLVSYCLVIHYQSMKAYSAGMLTALTNRIGDVMILMALPYLFWEGSWNFFPLQSSLTQHGMWPWVVMGLLVVAAMTKSAQIPFSAWLPAAMAAPTPVSSLVHSSTLVTAGVYLLIRFNGMLMESGASTSLFFLAGLTMLMAGLGANFEMDLKKIIALSTLSQLGLMMATLSLGFPTLAFFHLITHALFKALLFMSAGNYIHVMEGNQDIRGMGGLARQLPVTSACFALSNMALCGMPFLAGFYSKDLILELVLMEGRNVLSVLWFFIATGLTASYSVRLVYMALASPIKGKSTLPWGEENWGMVYPMMTLAIMATTGGAGLAWMILPSPPGVTLPLSLKGLTMLIIGFGFGLGGWGFKVGNTKGLHKGSPLNFYKSNLTWFGGGMWFLPSISTKGVMKLPLNKGGLYFKVLDRGWLETLGPQSVFQILKALSLTHESWQTQSMKVTLLSLMGIVGWGMSCLGISN